MSYNYEEQRAKLFTEQGMRAVLSLDERAYQLTKVAGCFKVGRVLSGDSWQCLAVLDYLVEAGRLVCISRAGPAQDWVFGEAP